MPSGSIINKSKKKKKKALISYLFILGRVDKYNNSSFKNNKDQELPSD